MYARVLMDAVDPPKGLPDPDATAASETDSC